MRVLAACCFFRLVAIAGLVEERPAVDAPAVQLLANFHNFFH
ncbi:hypothetical protein DFR52_10680 [Hoeflea marina]|uniref:Uncharacterized protein n=1 Tax=Hoeflea marina TaxID=274592 RepID=A0A317PIY6_9HYPH|nr:hypothetical protein DFR52_10680 [Hoeflea marina]